jgi:hypothetical protein
MNTTTNKKSTNKLLMAIFWLYVLVPLAWGVINTLIQAMKLFA